MKVQKLRRSEPGLVLKGLEGFKIGTGRSMDKGNPRDVSGIKIDHNTEGYSKTKDLFLKSRDSKAFSIKFH